MTEEKPAILKDYSFIKDIGEGNFGKVKLTILNSTKEKYAIKILNKERLKSQTKTTLFNEIEIISQLKHPNIVYVDKILEDEKNYYIIMEYCEKGELFDYIVKKERLSAIESSIFFYQLIRGVEYIHSLGLAHRDLKPENLLLTKEKILKIIDFGLCHDFNETKYLSTKCGSPSYAAPEILKGFPYDGFKTDIWCCGIILYAMLCGYLPFDGDDNQQIFQSIVEGELEFPNFLEDDSINLLIWLLNPEPKDRISIEEIKFHPFYLKGKKYFTKKYGERYEENEDISDESNEMENNNLLNYSPIDKRNFGFSTNRRKKRDIYDFNNIKTLKVKENKHFKNNIFQNIFNNIININIDNSSPKKEKEKERSPYLLTSFNNENKQSLNIKQNCDKKDDKNNCNNLEKINNNNINKMPLILETEANEDKSSFLLDAYNNKFKIDDFQKKNEKKDLSFIKKNINNDSYKYKHYNYDTLNPKLNSISYNSKSLNKKNDINNINFLSLDINKFNNYKSLGKKNNRKIFIRNNKFYNEQKNFILKGKMKENPNNNKNIRIIPGQLDFFQKYLITKNNLQTSEISPRKNIGINCNIISTKRKGKNNEDINENDNINSQKERSISGSKKKLDIKDRIILTQKRNNYNSIKNENNSIFNNKINLITSPARNINNYYQQNTKKNKYLNSIFGYNNSNINKNDIKGKTTDGKMNKVYCSSTIKKKHNHRNLIIDVNKKLNNLKLINVNNQSHSIKKEDKNNKYIYNNKQEFNINNNNLQSLNIVLKTESKNNHFLDKVIQKINSNKGKKSVKNKMNILMTDNNIYKNDENKQIFRLLSIERKNNNEYLRNPIIDKINMKSPIYFREEKNNLFNLNKKVKDKDKDKQIFPNLVINNKK